MHRHRFRVAPPQVSARGQRWNRLQESAPRLPHLTSSETI